MVKINSGYSIFNDRAHKAVPNNFSYYFLSQNFLKNQWFIKMSLRLELSIIMILVAVSSWECGGTRDEIHQGPLHQRHLFTRSSTLSPIRLTPFYLDFDLGSVEKNEYFKNTLYPDVEEFFKSRLKVYSVQEAIIIGFDTCLGFNIPPEHKTVGFSNTDVLIYIKSEYETTSYHAGYAGSCQIDTYSNNNVVAGLLMINTFYFNTYQFETQFHLLTHEIFHILGFSSELYAYWKDENGLSYSAPTEARTVRGISKFVLKTPNVIAKAKEAFGCSTITGIELEDFLSSGSAGSHWDMRIMFNDFMVFGISYIPIYSSISMALMKDTGWYEVDSTKADIPLFGRGAGCSFFDTKCVTDGVSNFPSLFCDKQDLNTCDTFALWKGLCWYKDFLPPFPDAYNYFNSSKIGGVPWADFCPIRLGYQNGNCRASDPAETLTDKDGLEVIGPNSHCFLSTLSNTNLYDSGTRCYEVISCSSTGATVKIGGNQIGCPFTGATITVPGMYGTITCPASKFSVKTFHVFLPAEDVEYAIMECATVIQAIQVLLVNIIAN